MSHLIPYYVTNSNGASVVPFDRSTGKLWTTAASRSFGGSSFFAAGPRLTATISGHTILSDTVSCWASPGATGIKIVSTPNQNATTCLDNAGRAECSRLLTGIPPSSITYNEYPILGGCTGTPTLKSISWRAEAKNYDDYVPASGLFTFEIRAFGVGFFLAIADSLCFPMTLSNLLTSGAVGSDQTVPFWGTVKRYGYGGTVTISLDDCWCP